MRGAIATLLLLACAEQQEVRWPAEELEAPRDLLLRRLGGQPLELVRLDTAVRFTWALSDQDALVLLRFDDELDRVLLDFDGPRIRLGDIALPTPKGIWKFERGVGLDEAAEVPEWARGLGVAPRCPALQGQPTSLPAGLRTSFSGPPGIAFAAYPGGLAELSAAGGSPRLWPQPVDVVAGVWSEGRLWVGLEDGRLAVLHPDSGAIGPSSPTSVALPIRGLAAAPDGTVVAVDGASVTWWSQAGGPFERGPTLDLAAPADDCRNQPVLLSWWPARTAFVAAHRAVNLPAIATRALMTVSRTEAQAERLAPDLRSIHALFTDDRGEPVILGQSLGIDAINPDARAVIRFDRSAREWRVQRPLDIPLQNAFGALGFLGGFLYVGQKGLFGAFRHYGDICSPEPVLGGGDYDGLVPLDEHHALVSECGEDTVYLVERR